MDKPTLESEWARFVAMVLPENAGAHQVRCMKDAFYAGAGSMLSLSAGASHGMSEDEAVAYLESLGNELEAFAADLLARH